MPVQATADYFEEEDSTRADGWKLPRVMMWLQKKHSGCNMTPLVFVYFTLAGRCYVA